MRPLHRSSENTHSAIVTPPSSFDVSGRSRRETPLTLRSNGTFSPLTHLFV
ncbi:hypothetical protein DVA67_011320 [Solirubrobacter sp. CPCC 204708]|nr:hypothetical protein [Solirubrobacter deserti]